MRSSCENLWSASKSVVSPAGPPTANRVVWGTRASLLRLSCLAAPLLQGGKIRLSQPIIRRGGPDSFATTGARAFSKKEKAAGMTAQSIDLRQASDPRIERVGDRLGRSALIDQRQRDARVSGSLYAPMCGSTGKIDSPWSQVFSKTPALDTTKVYLGSKAR